MPKNAKAAPPQQATLAEMMKRPKSKQVMPNNASNEEKSVSNVEKDMDMDVDSNEEAKGAQSYALTRQHYTYNDAYRA
jgi:hypothetical protein